MSLAVLNALVLAGAILGVDAQSLRYYDPPSLPWWPSYSPTYASSIVRTKEEKVLLEDSDTTKYVLGATSLVALVNLPYHQVQQAIKEIIANSLGIRNEHDSTTGVIPKPEAERPPYLGAEIEPWPEMGPGLSYLGKGLSFSEPLEYEITSRPYNQIESIGFSELRIRIVEATGILGRQTTLIELRRRDYCREWAILGRSVHVAIPLPYKEHWSFTLMTETEVKLIEQMKKTFQDVSIRYFLPSPKAIQYNDQYRATFRNSMMSE